MSLIHRIVGEQRASLAEPWLWDAFGGERSFSGVTVNDKSALGLDAVWSAVTLLSRSVGQLPCKVYEGTGRDKAPARSSPQWQLLHERPNGEMAPDQFFETVMGHLNLRGNHFSEKVVGAVKGQRAVVELWPLPSGKVTVERDKQSGEKRFHVDGVARTFGADTILHIPAFGYDGLQGLSPIAVHRQGLGAELARDEYHARFYANSADPRGVIQVTGTLSDEAAQRLKAGWEAAHRGLANSSRVAVLEEGATWQATGMSMEDQQFIEQSRFGVSRVARIFQVPPEKIGGDRSNSMTYQSVDAAGVDFVVFSLQHWMVRIEQALKHDQDVFPPVSTGRYPEFLAEGLLRGDAAARAKFYETMWRVRAITSNEIREKENMPPVGWGDDEPQPAGAAPNDPPPSG